MELSFIPEQMEAWWSPRGEIDVVAVSDETRAVLVGECKWSVNPIGSNVMEDLRRAASSLQEEEGWEIENQQKSPASTLHGAFCVT
jgi:hypothetical protein